MLFLWLQEARTQAEHSKLKEDPWDCATCLRRKMNRGRAFCVHAPGQVKEWVMPFSHPFLPVAPVRMTTTQVLAILPQRRPLHWLSSRRTLDGRQLCPVSVSAHPGAVQVLEWESDLDKWHVAPFEGSTEAWPAEVVDTLRVVRQTSGLIQNERWKPKEKDKDGGKQKGNVRAGG